MSCCFSICFNLLFVINLFTLLLMIIFIMTKYNFRPTFVATSVIISSTTVENHTHVDLSVILSITSEKLPIILRGLTSFIL